MNNGKVLLVLLLASMPASELYAQQSDDAERREIVERRGVEREAVNMEEEMRAAEVRLEEAARRIAELSERRLPRFGGQRLSVDLGGRPMLGIMIGGDTSDGPTEGAPVSGVTPGGPAFEAGLRAGDIITAINKESMSADSSAAASRKLLEFMAGVEAGDTLDVDYMRDGDVNEVSIVAESQMARNFVFAVPGMRVPGAPSAPGAPAAPGFSNFVFHRGQGGWGDMEMVTLTENLGRYFGTDKGLLVVRAPADENLKLQDGDVIHAIDGREPTSVSHAVRILGSYQSGEELKIDIMRDKRRQTLSIEMPDEWPDNRRSFVRPETGFHVAVDVVPAVRVRRTVED
jgi:S1-C subfamily serine protease